MGVYRKPYQKDPNQVGAAWIKKGAKGEWLSIALNIEGVDYSFIAFKNDFKKEDRHPDWIIKLSKPKEERQPPPEPEGDGECPF